MGAFLPTGTRGAMLPVAVVGAILSRVALAVEFRRKMPDIIAPLARPISQWRWMGYLVAAAFLGAGALMMYGGATNPGGSVVIIVGVVIAAVGVAIAVKVGRRR